MPKKPQTTKRLPAPLDLNNSGRVLGRGRYAPESIRPHQRRLFYAVIECPVCKTLFAFKLGANKRCYFCCSEKCSSLLQNRIKNERRRAKNARPARDSLDHFVMELSNQRTDVI